MMKAVLGAVFSIFHRGGKKTAPAPPLAIHTPAARRKHTPVDNAIDLAIASMLYGSSRETRNRKNYSGGKPAHRAAMKSRRARKLKVILTKHRQIARGYKIHRQLAPKALAA